MDLSQDGIVSKSFSKRIFGGLDEFEVRDFLHVLAEEMNDLLQKNIQQKQKIEEKETLIRDYRDREHILKESISSAEKWAEKIRKDAESNSILILEKAQNNSENLIQEARHSLQSVYNDIANLKRLQLQFKTGLKAALQVQMDLLEQDPIFTSSSLQNNKQSSNSTIEENSYKKEPDSFKKNLESVDDSHQDLNSLRESLKSLDKDFS